MGFLTWCSRCATGLSMLVLIGLCYWVISRESMVEQHGFKFVGTSTEGETYSSNTTNIGAGIWTLIFAYYCLLIHFMVAMFPIRACWSIWSITHSLKRGVQSRAMEEYKDAGRRRNSSSSSVASSETLASSNNNGISSTDSELSDSPSEYYVVGKDVPESPIIHAIVIPNYKEEMDTLRETLDVLASHPQAQSRYDVYLGMELRETGGESKARSLIQQFVKKFRSIDYTLHPGDIPGEAAGKGSNMAWAARKLSSKYPMFVRKNVIVTGIDADSHLSSRYFAQISNLHMIHPDTASTTLYAAPIIFDRNAHNVTALVRVADVLWCAAGMSGLYKGSAIAPPTSVYSLPLVLVDRVGGWDCDSDAIGEDLHMFIKCFFALNGHLTCRTVLSPVSQTNVTGGGKGGLRGAYLDIKARYSQALRHMWGALDSGFALRKAAAMWKDRKYTSRAFRPLHRSASGDDLDAYFPESQVEETAEVSVDNGVFSDITRDTLKEPHWEHIFYMGHRLFEAHFLPLQMLILVVASALYTFVTEGSDDPNNLSWIFLTCNVLRTMGFMEMAVYIFLYESYHRVCVRTRERDMIQAGLADGMCFSQRSLKKNFVDYLLVPMVAPLYGAIPCAQAEIAHFWTADLQYTVSKKALRQRAKFVTVEDIA
ncbi:CAZyme family GT2 [Trichoderma aggressivum f. europaeum]|uniref:CAZyme family GT2 n=1 Tax=Trichoderma aggressivum f. europaeum TaxID=173218 RepID=A0AAE1JIY0_9HYPO|nr:CAZyme family GT2 [Trichoderma aggressivum f. europaeum]